VVCGLHPTLLFVLPLQSFVLPHPLLHNGPIVRNFIGTLLQRIIWR
jgi:hypothetical protein